MILSLLDTPAFGGAETYMLTHLVNLAQHDYPVVLATNNKQVKKIFKSKIDQLGIEKLEIIDLPYRLDAIGNWKGLIKYFISLPKALFWITKTVKTHCNASLATSNQQLIALLPGYTDRLTFSPIIKHLGAKLIWIEIGPLEPTFKKNWGFPNLLYKLTRYLPDHHITTSKWTMRSMINTGGINKKNITLVYPGITPITNTQLSVLRKQGQNWKKEQKINHHKLITYVGRLADENQVDLLIKAFSQINTKLTNWKLIIIGDGPTKNNYQNLIKKLDLNNQTIFTGFISEKEKSNILSVSDIFVFTRSWDLDGFGITTIEAMQHRAAVINPKFGPQKEITTDNQTGLQFKPNNANDLAKKILELAKNEKLRKKLAQAGFKEVNKKFNQNIYLDKMLRVIEKSR